MSTGSTPPAANAPIDGLAELDTPAAGPTFWEELHALLVVAADEPARRTGPDPGGAPDPAVAALVPDRSRRRVRWTPLIVSLGAAAAVALVIAMVVMGRPGATEPGPADAPGTVVATGSTPVAPDPSAPTAAPSTAATESTRAPELTSGRPDTASALELGRTLTVGTAGDDVRAVQQRLADVGFDPGPVDGTYGSYTEQAVWAFETLVLGRSFDEVTGAVTPEVWAALQDDVVVTPRRTDLTPTHVEIYLPEQALVVFQDGRPALVAHISSGELASPGDDFEAGMEWCREVTIAPGEIGNEQGTEPRHDGRCGNSATPGGTYRAYRRVEGRVDTVHGPVYDPVYFNYGIAVHGAERVPSGPSTRGGIALNRWLAPRFADLVDARGRFTGDQIYVWNGVLEPEDYGAKPGRFDWAWQEWRDAQRSAGD